MPEIQHGKDAILGKSGIEIANHIYKAMKDKQFRRKLGLSGIETLSKDFSSNEVAKVIQKKIIETPI